MPRRSSPGRIRSTMDSVFLHDMKNLEFRLNLLLSNLEEHYGDPEFKRSVVEMLEATLEKVDSVVGNWSAHRERLLIKVSLDLNDLLVHAVRELRSREGRRASDGGAIATCLETVPPVWGDPHFLKNAFVSLLQNATEAAGVTGHVEVTTRVEEGRAARWVCVEISDDGHGMSPEFIRQRLFRPFQSTKGDGVGLGLYTSREIFRVHKGRIRVDSRLGKGTTVLVKLPAARQDKPK